MAPEIERARRELEIARATSQRLWAEYDAFVKTLGPQPAVMGAEQFQRLREASEWSQRVIVAEHALFQAEHNSPGIVGTQGDYQWITMYECDISSLLKTCPEIVLNKYLAVTSIDSGPLKLAEEERINGWWTSDNARVFLGSSWGYRDDRGEVAFSPRLSSIHGLPNETHGECCDGFDEWYVFDRVIPAMEMETFVNWCGFRLYDAEFKWCKDRFWDQMTRLTPESYLSDGTVFTFATRNEGLFSKALDAFSKHGR
jgi:hypothetical protein